MLLAAWPCLLLLLQFSYISAQDPQCQVPGECLGGTLLAINASTGYSNCQTLCAALTTPTACTWFTYNPDVLGGACLQYSTDCLSIDDTNCAGCFTGQSTCPASVCEVPGYCLGPQIGGIRPVTSFEECNKLCYGEPECMSFSVCSNSLCLLTNITCTTLTASPDCFYGEKTCFTGPYCDLPGVCKSDHFVTMVLPTKEACDQWCVDDPTCLWSSFCPSLNECLKSADVCTEFITNFPFGECVSSERKCFEGNLPLPTTESGTETGTTGTGAGNATGTSGTEAANSTGTDIIIPTVPTPSQGFNTLFVVGGIESPGSVEVVALNSNSNSTCTLSNMPAQAAGYGSVGAYVDGKAIICGGYVPTTECYEYNPANDQWSISTTVMNGRRYSAAGVVLSNGGWWVTGGNDGFADLKTTEVYMGGSFVPQIDLPDARSGHNLIQLSPTQVMLLGNKTYNGATRKVWKYDQSLGQWLNVTNLRVARNEAQAGLVNLAGRQAVMVVGGYFASTSEMMYLDAQTAWVNAPHLGLWSGASVQYGDTFLVVGGTDNISSKSTIYVFNTALQRWDLLTARMSTARHEFTAFLVPDDFVQC